MSTLGGQLPLPVVVNIKLAKPAVSSAAVGEYEIFAKVVLFGEKTPEPPLQMPVETPVTDPLMITNGLCLHLVLSGPAFALIAEVNEVTEAEANTGAHPEASLS